MNVFCKNLNLANTFLTFNSQTADGFDIKLTKFNLRQFKRVGGNLLPGGGYKFSARFACNNSIISPPPRENIRSRPWWNPLDLDKLD